MSLSAILLFDEGCVSMAKCTLIYIYIYIYILEMIVTRVRDLKCSRKKFIFRISYS